MRLGPRSVLGAAAVILCPAIGLAQEPVAEAEAHRSSEPDRVDLGFLALEYQPVLRTDVQTGPSPQFASVPGLSPLRFALSAGVFGPWPVGLVGSIARESYALQGTFTGSTVTLPYVLYDGSAGLGVRARIGGLRLQGAAGYAYDDIALVDPFGTTVQAVTAHRQSVLLALNIGYQFTPGLLAQVEGRVPIAFSTQSSMGALSGFEFDAGARVFFGRLDVLSLLWSLDVHYEFSDQKLSRSDGFAASHVAHVLGIGLRAALPQAPPVVAVVEQPREEKTIQPTRPAGPQPGTIIGTVVLGDARKPLEGARVAVSGTTVEATTDAKGVFVLEGVTPGAARVTATADGCEPAQEDVVVPEGGRATLEMKLQKVGFKPVASIRGVVRSRAGRPLPAHIFVVEPDLKARAGTDGRFLIRLPGGHYTVRFEAPGYVKQTKVVDVADGEEAVFDIELHPRLQ